MPDEEKELRKCPILQQLAKIAETIVMSQPLTDQEKAMACV